MRPPIIGVLFILNVCFTYGQTYDLEKQNLSRIISEKSKTATPQEMQQLGEAWRSLLEDFGGYPDLPYNPLTQEVEYMFVYELSDLKKGQIYTRIIEWIAINYGSIKEVLHYESLEAGKVIVKGWIPIQIRETYRNLWGRPRFDNETVRSIKCEFTAVHTIKDGKLKLEFSNLKYLAEYEGIVSGSFYIPETTTTSYIWELYPVTSALESQWKGRLSTLERTTHVLEHLSSELSKYIVSAEEDYRF